MNIDGLKWLNSRPPIDEEEIQDIERKLGVKLPRDFIECVKKYHGGHPLVNEFTYTDIYLGPVGSCFGQLFSFDSGDMENIIQNNEVPPEDFPEGLVMFGYDGGGGYICFDYRTTKTAPSVVFWISDAPSADEIIPLADTFTGFVEMLYEPADLPED